MINKKIHVKHDAKLPLWQNNNMELSPCILVFKKSHMIRKQGTEMCVIHINVQKNSQPQGKLCSNNAALINYMLHIKLTTQSLGN